nr:ribonuclease H-like domain-containing protein [Tanacetum cinerariifolium]
MAVEDTPPPHPPPSHTDKIIPFSIPNKVPIKLDLEKHNYNSWSSFSLIYLGSLGLKSHVEEDTASNNPDWCQLDDLIKMWILGSLCDSLQEQVVTTPGNAKALWDHLKELFHDNKDARPLNLDNELRSIKIGKMTVNEYCTKIKSMTDRLKNLGCVVSDKNLMIYTVNGLDSESSFTDDSGATTTFESSSSSPTVLMTSTSSSTKGNTNKPSTISQICNHFNRGTCKFGDRCKLIHDHRIRVGLSSSHNPNRRNNSSLAGIWNTSSSAPPHYRPANPQNQPRPPTNYQPSPIAYYTSPSRTPYQAQPKVAHYQQPATSIHQQQQPTPQMVYQAQPQPVAQSQSGILGPTPAFYSSQATSLPSAFSTMSLQDPTWNMDTCATSHLNYNARNLSTLLNKRLFSSIHVGDSNSVLITNTGHSIIPSYHLPIHLHNVLVTPNIIKNLIYVHQFTRDNNCTIEFDAFGFFVKDFLTRHILLQRDSSGDLYPVTKPSTLPAAFVSTSSTTWHQRLSHPGDKVLRSISSRQFISCNKAKSTHVCHACQLDPNWCNAMYDKYNALVKNDTWILVPRPTDANLVRSIWLFKHKFHADGTLSRYTARLVANGSSQRLGVDFDETFSPVVKPATIRTAPRAWFQRFAGYVTQAGFSPSRCDSSLFIYTHGSQVAYLLIYVDDIILTASSPVLLQQIVDSLHKEFDMTDLRELNYFLGISVVRHPTWLFLSQKKYDLQLLERAHMANCNPSRTPVDTDSKLGPDGVPLQDPTLYRSLVGGLQYLTFTRPDLSYAVQQVCLYMHDLREPRFVALKRILRYVQGTLELGVHLYASATTSLIGYTDADWAGFPSTRRSTSGYYVFLGDNLLSWSAKRQHTISCSSAEAEYRGVANVVAETAWIRNLLRELYSPLLIATLVYCDNAGHVRVLHVPSRFQYADIFTKCLPSALFKDFRFSLSVRPPPAQTAGAY